MPPEAGQAQLVLIENNDRQVSPFSYATIRFGMDGAWVGADIGNSYFELGVDPGEHPLCASWQSSAGRAKKNIDVGSFTAEAGKVYCFAANITMTGGGMVRGAPLDIFFNLAQRTEDEAKYRVKAWTLSASMPSMQRWFGRAETLSACITGRNAIS